MFRAKIERRPGEVALIVPEQVLSEFEAGSADVLYLTRASDGSLRLSHLSPEVQAQVQVGLEIMEEYDEALRALAQ